MPAVDIGGGTAEHDTVMPADFPDFVVTTAAVTARLVLALRTHVQSKGLRQMVMMKPHTKSGQMPDGPNLTPKYHACLT